ncbi:MAG: squalene/phytoene synthase family protein [Planctomycetota bacterium]|nr:squalene/phytoene synthase family protein [Planctomycetota bacterium]MEC8653720.1 squalene/phytoene synthase family protein [Planctomycetota bacterium]
MSEASVQRPPDAELDPRGITARSGSNFLAGFVCLDEARREAMTAIYAFCRVVDDAVDESPDPATGAARLAYWGEELEAAAAARARAPVGLALQDAMQRFGVRAEPLRELVAGCATDLDPDGPADEAALELYCYRVASCVGLTCLPVLGADSADGRRYATALGHALQLTNVLRDLRGDAEIGRCYVPATWLAECGVERRDLLGTSDAALYAGGGGVTRLCERFAQRARERFAEAHALLRSLPREERRGLVAARIMGAVYAQLLRRLERRAGDLILPRVRVPKWRKLWAAVVVWAGVRA